MKIIAFSNTKGGTGKSTCSISIAGSLAKRGNRVLLVDADPATRTSTTWFGLDDPGPDILQAFVEQNSLAPFVQSPEGVENLDVLPSTLYFEQAEGLLSTRSLAATQELSVALQEFSDYDFVLLDTPPQPSSFFFKSALVAADRIVVVVDATLVGVTATLTALEIIERHSKIAQKPDLFAGLILNRHDQRLSVSNQVHEYLTVQDLNVPIWIVSESTGIQQAQAERTPISHQSGLSNTAKRVVRQFRSITKEIEAA